MAFILLLIRKSITNPWKPTRKVSINLRHLCVAALFGLAGLTAHAFPIAPLGTEGFKVIVGSTDDIIARYEGNSAGYSNDLYLVGRTSLIFNNHASPVGSVVNLGSFAVGTELVFRLHVNNTNQDYYTGPANRNPDNLYHARVQDEWQPGTTLVSFEDLFNTPEAPGGYNDLSFSFTNTRSQGVPDVGTTAAMLGIALAGLATLRRKVAK
jgi:hypothetical protein